MLRGRPAHGWYLINLATHEQGRLCLVHPWQQTTPKGYRYPKAADQNTVVWSK
jgi:hypothetical protein